MSLNNTELNGIKTGLAELAIDRGDRAAAKAAKAASIYLYGGSYYPETAADHVAQNIALGVACWLRYDTEAPTSRRCAEAQRWSAMLADAMAWDVSHPEAPYAEAQAAAYRILNNEPTHAVESGTK